MTQANPKAVLVGELSLLSLCGDLLRDRGWQIESVVTKSPDLREWSQVRGVRCLATVSELRELEGFDWLISVTNLRILPAEIVALARRGAVNFHDGPLPGYAGLNAPSWAILAGESQHAITWHRVGDVVDGGDVLVERTFPIDPDETAFTLNSKAYEAASEGFAELAERMEEGTVVPLRSGQRPTKVFYRKSRPRGFGALDWSQPATELDRLVRALDFANYPNPLCTAKILTHVGWQLVSQVEVVSERDPSAIPGQVLEVGDTGLVVAAGSGALRIGQLQKLCGEPLAPSDLEIAPGDRLPGVEETGEAECSATRLTAGGRDTAWMGQWRAHVPVRMPYLELAGYSNPAPASPLTSSIVEGQPLAQSLAFVAHYLGRLNGLEELGLAYSDRDTRELARASAGLVLDYSVLDCRGLPVHLSLAGRLERELAEGHRIPLHRDFAVRAADPELGDLLQTRPDACFIALDAGEALAESLPAPICFVHRHDRDELSLVTDDSLSPDLHDKLRSELVALIDHWLGDPVADLSAYELIAAEESERIEHLNAASALPVERETVAECLTRAARTFAGRTALVHGEREATFQEFDALSSQFANQLIARGLSSGHRIGILMERSADAIVALHGVLKSGAAYVPLDPRYPESRIDYIIEDSGVSLIVTDEALRPETAVETATFRELLGGSADTPADGWPVVPADTAYMIYTSGSTGRPKGVCVNHGNVVNFFAAMDEQVAIDTDPVLLAVTSISFDISVLELFWTFSRGIKIVLFDDAAADQTPAAAHESRPMDFSLFFWNSVAPDAGAQPDTYKLMLDAGRFADENGFCALWTPERHFGSFGGIYPNPAVTGAALASITHNVEIRAGSCVLPLHHPVRVAEEWSVIDNLTGGRAGLAIASGWMPNDFVLRPENFENSKQKTREAIEILRRLWRGEAVSFPGPKGDVEVRTLPRPIQPELPIWLTTAGSPDTFRQAGELGANVLTHLLGQSFEEIEGKIEVYRAAWREAGHAGEGRVTLMLHTLVGDDTESVKELAREPMKSYLKSAVSLVKDAAWEFPTFKKFSDEGTRSVDDYFENADEQELDDLLDFAFERYFSRSGLFGDTTRAREVVNRAKAVGVDEIGCLVDFGVAAGDVMSHLEYLNEVRQQTSTGQGEAGGFADLCGKHRVTHLQCTPSQAAMLSIQAEDRAALGRLEYLMVGGEAVSQALADDLCGLVQRGRVLNMYGPTETTVWSAVSELRAGEPVTVGGPIANTELLVIDEQQRRVPIGVPGELLIGGLGVTDGYHGRQELTADRFVRRGDGVFYRTGDLVRWRPDGELDFLGRLDHQVKVRGYRIELEEIESILREVKEVQEAVVSTVSGRDGTVSLAAYLVPQEKGLPRFLMPKSLEASAMRKHIRQRLPEYMVPQFFTVLDHLPLTPNGKLDRAQLPAPEARSSRQEVDPPRTEVEQAIARIWEKAVDAAVSPGRHDNFFDIGGHSVLAMQVIADIEKALGVRLPIRYLVMEDLAEIAARIEPPLPENGGWMKRIAARLKRGE